MTKLTHEDLMYVGTLLGYGDCKKGLCQGFSCMLAQAVLAQDTEIFFERVDFIASYKSDFKKLKTDIEAAQDKSKMQNPLASVDKKLLEILAFFEGIALYLKPFNHRDLFNVSSISQENIEAIYPIVRSHKLELEKSDISVVLNKFCAFNKEDNADSLTVYLTDLAKVLHKIKEPLPILLGSDTHSVFVLYDKDINHWLFSDTNDFNNSPSEPYLRKLNHSALADKLFDSFLVVFETIVLANSQNNTAKIKELLGAFDNDYPIQPEQATLYNKNGTGLLFLVCRSGNLGVVKELLKQKNININQLNQNLLSPLYIACRRGHLAIVKELLEETDIKINQYAEVKVTPLYIACEKGDVDRVEELLRQKDININQPIVIENGDFPLSIACDKGDVELVKVLLEHDNIKIDSTVGVDEYTPLQVA